MIATVIKATLKVAKQHKMARKTKSLQKNEN